MATNIRTVEVGIAHVTCGMSNKLCWTVQRLCWRGTDHLPTQMTIRLLNTSVLTSFGSYTYEPLTLEEAQSLAAKGFESAIGHEEAATVLSELLNTHVPVNRAEYVQQPGEKAIIFKLKSRIPAGVVLGREQINR